MATAAVQNAHYHIVWRTDGTWWVDYDAFANITDAKKAAEKLARRGETYQVKEYPDGCDFDCPAWKNLLGKPE